MIFRQRRLHQFKNLHLNEICKIEMKADKSDCNCSEDLTYKFWK